MVDYQLWGFVYLNVGDDGINAITGTKEESEFEEEIQCFDGFSCFTFRGHYYVAKYPKLSELTDVQKSEIKRYCGYEPESGEFGVVMGALGEVLEIDKTEYDKIVVW